jgi:predicted 3-demethylubiquinone-9 3-methyltransferase (glyoxalase superfamily)
MQRITPFLWFDTQAEEAANHYVSIFRNSKIKRIARYGDAGPGPKGSVMIVEVELDGNGFVLLNGGTHYKISPAVSFVVNCKDQAEVDYYWDKLTAGGKPIQCGWLEDRFGVSWQVVPARLTELMVDPDPAKAGRVTEAMLKMIKLDLPTLEQAARAA